VREAARDAAEQLRDLGEAPLRDKLYRIAADDPDRDFAGVVEQSRKVLLSLAFSSFQGKPQDEPLLAEQVYQQLEQSTHEPFFPLQPTKALLPFAPLASLVAEADAVLDTLPQFAEEVVALT